MERKEATRLQAVAAFALVEHMLEWGGGPMVRMLAGPFTQDLRVCAGDAAQKASEALGRVDDSLEGRYAAWQAVHQAARALGFAAALKSEGVEGADPYDVFSSVHTSVREALLSLE